MLIQNYKQKNRLNCSQFLKDKGAGFGTKTNKIKIIDKKKYKRFSIITKKVIRKFWTKYT